MEYAHRQGCVPALSGSCFCVGYMISFRLQSKVLIVANRIILVGIQLENAKKSRTSKYREFNVMIVVQVAGRAEVAMDVKETQRLVNCKKLLLPRGLEAHEAEALKGLPFSPCLWLCHQSTPEARGCVRAQEIEGAVGIVSWGMVASTWDLGYSLWLTVSGLPNLLDVECKGKSIWIDA